MFQFRRNFREVNPESGKAPGWPKPNLKKVKRILTVVVLAALVLAVANSCWFTIQEEQQAVVCTFGQPRAVTEPGLHFKIPLIQTVTKVNTTIQGLSVGYDEEENYTDDAMMITSDYNFIRVDFYAEYRISDPVKALYASEDPVTILDNIAQNCIRTTIGSYGVDSVLTTGKNEIQANIKQMIMDKLENYDIGIQLVNISIQDAQPPTAEVVTAFKEVETAKQGKETALNNANKYRNEQIPEAKAEADKVVQDAQAQKESRINEAEGQVARFNSMYEEYIKYPTITKQRMFYETMEDVMPDMKIIIQGGEGGQVQQLLPLEPFNTVIGSGNAAGEEGNDNE
ncbi:MAG: FtsH protease activity modulator HflK [Lachnospiraceae bacterium]|uniref:FtsH protease activity modulator HflK n=1 Tax=Candidatus Merdisoma sp. JLR.KK006 TaxID=3112626 RepID=UPI002FF16262|nr:FtsH protease activity modulator HflK [Lachnospiraceae bacterium]